VICMDLTTNGDYLLIQHWLIGFFFTEGPTCIYCAVRAQSLNTIDAHISLGG
jgi:hypothetical protein